MKYLFKLIASLLLLVPYTVVAVELNPMIITATGTPQTVDKTLASVTIISRADIERRQAISLPEILRGVPGLIVTNSGGLGKQTSIFMRGTESDHTLVLIDGIRVGQVTSGLTAFEHLPLDQIERIEIVRGPRASLYGSDAIGGVIHIFTRRASQDLKPSLVVSGGSHGTYKVAATLSGTYQKSWFNLSLSHLNSDAFNACSGRPFGQLGAGGCFTIEPDKDGYDNTAGSVRLGHEFTNGLKIEANFLQAVGDNAYDGDFGNESEFVQQVLGGSIKYSPLDFWDISLRAGRSQDQSDTFSNGVYRSTFDTDKVHFTWQNDFSVHDDHLISLGLDFYNDSVESSTDYAETSRDNLAGFGQYQGSLANLDWVLGVRYDDNEQFGGQATGNVGLAYLLEHDIRLTASWGSAFKAPNFNELYWPNFGNPALVPEESWTSEVGINSQQLGVDWSINGYYTEIDNLIAVFPVVNIDKAEIYGLEASVKTRIMDWDIASNFNYINHQNRGNGANKGKRLARRPNTTFQLDIDRQLDRFSLGSTVYVAGKRFDDVANSKRLGGYVRLDLRASIKLIEHLSIEGKVSNLLDKQYETVQFYNQDGRNFLISLRYRL